MSARPSFCHVISLDPGGARYRDFAANNAHLGHPEVFHAIRGADIPPAERVASGLMTADLTASGSVTEGSVGCAASHRALWRRIAGLAQGAMILEDDAFTHPELPDYIAAHRKALDDADIVLFGVNMDSVLATVSPQGVTSRSGLAPKYPDAGWIESAFGATALADVRRHRLLNAFGLCCYWLSPSGAQRLLAGCYPLTLEPTEIPGVMTRYPGSAIDTRLNAFFPRVEAYVTLPFLAYTPNLDSSTLT